MDKFDAEMLCNAPVFEASRGFGAHIATSGVAAYPQVLPILAPEAFAIRLHSD